MGNQTQINPQIYIDLLEQEVSDLNRVRIQQTAVIRQQAEYIQQLTEDTQPTTDNQGKESA